MTDEATLPDKQLPVEAKRQDSFTTSEAQVANYYATLAAAYRARPKAKSPHKSEHKGTEQACRCKGDYWCYCNEPSCWCNWEPPE